MWYLVIFLGVIYVLLILLLLTSLIMSKKSERNNYSSKYESMSDIECTLCHKNNIKTRLPITNSFFGGKIGPKYLINKKKVGINIMHCAPMYVDICLHCGNVLRTYIDVPKQADWIHKSNSLSKN